MNKELIIIGASGHGKVIADIALKMNRYDKIYFLDDNEKVKECMGFAVVGKTKDVYNYLSDSDVFVAIGNSNIRKNIMEDLKSKGANIPTLIHPNAIIGTGVTIGLGTVVMPGAIINPDSIIGEGCIINTAASIDHDCVIQNYVHVSVDAHLAGTVKVSEHTWIGIGAAVKNNVSIGANIMIGAGAVVVKDLIESGTYIGVPAQKMNK